MPIQVAAGLIPKGGAKWPIVDDVYVKGGLRVVANAIARDLLYTDPTAKLCLKTGMLLVTANDYKIWQYAGNGIWMELRTSMMYSQEFAVPETEWLISHNKGSNFFTYTLFNSDGFQILPNSCQILDNNNLKITFLQATAGNVTLTFNV